MIAEFVPPHQYRYLLFISKFFFFVLKFIFYSTGFRDRRYERVDLV